jgi:hypothetical protein
VKLSIAASDEGGYFMAWLAKIALYVVVVFEQIVRGRREHARGVKFEWAKAFALGGGCIVVSLTALGGLFFFLSLDDPWIALIVCTLVLGGGLPALMIAVTRRWPTVANPQRQSTDT